jgi:hypothetical protein
MESKFKTSSKIDEELADFCNSNFCTILGIKNRLFKFCVEEGENIEDV